MAIEQERLRVAREVAVALITSREVRDLVRSDVVGNERPVVAVALDDTMEYLFARLREGGTDVLVTTVDGNGMELIAVRAVQSGSIPGALCDVDRRATVGMFLAQLRQVGGPVECRETGPDVEFELLPPRRLELATV